MQARWRLLGREGCGLCEDMAAELAARFPDIAAALEVADVDSREDWRRRYGLRIPVLMDPWDEVICEGRLDADAVSEIVRELRTHPRSAP